MYWLKNNWFFIIAAVILVFFFIFEDPEENQAVEPAGSIPLSEEPPTEVKTTKITQLIKVDIKGEVGNPGIYEMKTGERIVDVVKKAGGLTKEAEADQVNLAQKLTDEMLIFIPKKESDGISSVSIPSIKGQADRSKIRLNQATAEEIMTLNGIGTKKAEAIVSYREENGPFTVPEDLLEVSGIGESTLENIREMIQIP